MPADCITDFYVTATPFSTDSSLPLIVLIPICSEVPFRLSRSASSGSMRVSVHPLSRNAWVERELPSSAVTISGTTFNRTWALAVPTLVKLVAAWWFLLAWCRTPCSVPCWGSMVGAGGFSWLTLLFESVFLFGLKQCPMLFSLCNSNKWRPGHLVHPGGSGQDEPVWLGLWRPQLKQNPYDAAYCRLTATQLHCLMTGHCCNWWGAELQKAQTAKVSSLVGLSIWVEEIVESFRRGGGGTFLFFELFLPSLFSSFVSRLGRCNPNTGSFLIEACLLTNCRHGVPWRLTIL